MHTISNLEEGFSVIFYGNIEGLDFQWGMTHYITVNETRINNPPADASGITLELITIDSQVEMAIGAKYILENVSLADNAITLDENNRFYLFTEEVICPETADCEQLLNSNNMGVTVNLQLEYPGDGNIALAGYF